ncbi:MAG: hypothetical protein G01um101420_771 [Parcubacteria group bacterium Gr01-1014_20]|nr:MAG: hypothetical protein G01um101420_771 [Parcubacteria group bacterium Gr01-1014_20]
METVAKVVQESDPLSRPFREISSWSEWKKKWTAVTTVEEAFGLLHVGFAVPEKEVKFNALEEERADRVQLYLEVSNGHAFFPSSQKRTLRQKVAEKAWKVLCNEVFASRGRMAGFTGTDWSIFCTTPAVFRKLLWFFTVGEGQNLPTKPTHDHDVARKFLLWMISFVWQLETPDRDQEKLYKDSRPLMAEMLCRMDVPEIIHRSSLEVDEPTLTRLKKLALSLDTKFSGHRAFYRNVDEAVFYRSRIAELVVVIEASRRGGQFWENQRAREEAAKLAVRA